ncbi:hypothetical protein BDV25DRAFT_154146 [Aspergillus avenaceus]|uniref:Uncharacterized protein n=1 Tax=Aspergillus avenaceus TaxID=36643 RepID=A0A5N6TVY4_ASPAV|nr:hypothetical protein BDV25DRAFT_154146 [Aspergillus avenaceus]
MKRCLGSARLCLDRRSPLHHPSSVASIRLFNPSLPRALPSWRPAPRRRQWSRQFSTGPPIDRRLLRNHAVTERKTCPVADSEKKCPEAWMSLLEPYLEPYLQRDSEDLGTASEPDTVRAMTAEFVTRTLDLAELLFCAKHFGNLDLLAHIGFRLNNWPAVDALVNQLLDVADTLNNASLPIKPLSNGNWGFGTDVSLDQLTGQALDSVPHLKPDAKTQVSELTSLDSFTERAYANESSRRLMAQVWQGLGSIVLDAADASPNESKLAMSYVFRILARLHHSGAVSDRVYKYVPPSSEHGIFRPPTMHLLSTHIMSVLSDAAWLVHEAEVAAKAAAAGEDSPFLPLKMGIRELGPEIWLELILWCCVEHGHITEGAWLIDQMVTRKGDLAWKFQSWRPLLQHPDFVFNTKIDSEETWRHPAQTNPPPSRRKRGSPPSPFFGLGRRTLSLEVATALLDNLPNLVSLGLGFRGISSTSLLRYVSSFKSALSPQVTGDDPLPTAKESNWFALRVVQSGGFEPEADPGAFDDFLRAIRHVVPPWDSTSTHALADDLDQVSPSQIYDETAALATLTEHNVRFYARRDLCKQGMDAFAWLQAVFDKSKMARIGEFFSSRMDSPETHHVPTLDSTNLASLKPFESSLPHISPVTLASILDLATASRAFPFGQWLLFSSDIDGPPIPTSAYGHQAVAPAILRFAAATKNSALSDSVVNALAQPLSINTLRALLNYRIAMHQWDLATMTLEYLKSYRHKTWGHSNVTTLAAEILRLQHTPEPNTAQAKDLLTRLLKGDFNESQSNFQEKSLITLNRIFLSIPALHDIAQTTKPTTTKTTPYIPSRAFQPLLAAIADTQGSAAAKHLYATWCITTPSPSTLRRQKGGNPRLYLRHERNPAKGDPHFNPTYFKQVQMKQVFPDPTAVRLIAQAALAEYNASSDERARDAARETLEFCTRQFLALGLRRREVNGEVGGLIYRKRKEMKQLRNQSGRSASASASAGQAPAVAV